MPKTILANILTLLRLQTNSGRRNELSAGPVHQPINPQGKLSSKVFSVKIFHHKISPALSGSLTSPHRALGESI